MAAVPRIQPGGLLIALSGFGITRFFVAETLTVDATLPFVIAGLVPLVVGFLLTIYGVVLAIGPFEPTYVNTVARWHLLGVGGMVLVFALTSLEQVLRGGGIAFGYDSPLLVANVLLGGAVGGTLTGVRSGKVLEQRREIQRSANRALLVTRLLKHEALNAITIIGGHADQLDSSGERRPESLSAIHESVDQIKSTVEEVSQITANGHGSGRVDAASLVRREVESIESEYGVDVHTSIHTDDTQVIADGRLAVVIRELLTNAIVHGEGDVEVDLRSTHQILQLSIADSGPGLSADQRALLEDGSFPEYDDPTTGFGLQIVRLLTVQFGGDIAVDTGTAGGRRSAVTLELPREASDSLSTDTIGVTLPNLGAAVVGGVIGGVAMGLFYQYSTGLMPIIGSLYGVQSPLIGWITHLFHSALFGMVFAGICAIPGLGQFNTGRMRAGVLGLAWATMLWLVAAGLLMPFWLVLTGVSATLPTLSLPGFIGHAIWGVALGVTYYELG
jgi:signal transduction histidine kinase